MQGFLSTDEAVALASFNKASDCFKKALAEASTPFLEGLPVPAHCISRYFTVLCNVSLQEQVLWRHCSLTVRTRAGSKK